MIARSSRVCSILRAWRELVLDLFARGIAGGREDGMKIYGVLALDMSARRRGGCVRGRGRRAWRDLVRYLVARGSRACTCGSNLRAWRELVLVMDLFARGIAGGRKDGLRICGVLAPDIFAQGSGPVACGSSLRRRRELNAVVKGCQEGTCE